MKNNFEDIFENPLRHFDGTTSGSYELTEFDFEQLAKLDDYLMPWGCKSYDEYEGIDEYELLGKED